MSFVIIVFSFCLLFCRFSEEVDETSLKSPKQSPAKETETKKSSENEKVVKEKILSYSKRLQVEVCEILVNIKLRLDTMDPELATEIKLMTSSMLKTCLKIQDKIGIRHRNKT